MDFFLWKSERTDDSCVMRQPRIKNIWELDDAVPRLESLEKPVECHMSPRYPKDVALTDNLYGAGMPVVSAVLKTAIAGATANRVEYLPTQIINHKGRTASEEYFVLHPIDMCDCIDLARSGVQWNEISPHRISYCNGLVLRADAIPENYTLFRPKSWGENILVRGDLVEILQKGGFTGLYFRPTEGYTGIG